MIKQWFVTSFAAALMATLPQARFAQAQTTVSANPNRAQIDSLFEQAMVDMEAQKYADACNKLEQVTVLLPNGIGGHEMLGECHEKSGRLGSAFEQYKLAQTLAYAVTDPRAEALGARAKQLEPRVAHLTIVVPQELRARAALSILHDGRVEEKPRWDVSLPVDKRKHVLEIEAPGFVSWKGEIDVKADGQSYTVVLPTQLAIMQPLTPPQSGVVRPGQSALRPLGWTFASMGVASGIASGLLVGIAVRQQDASNTSGHCDDFDRCDKEGLAMRDRAIHLANGALVAGIAGGVLAVGGITLLIAAPKKLDDAPRRTTASTWTVNVSPQGVRLGGTW